MLAVLLLAVVGSAVAAPQFRPFAPLTFTSQFAPPDTRFSGATSTAFAPPVSGFQSPVVAGRAINLDSTVFTPTAPVFNRGFDGTTSVQPTASVLKRTEYLNDNGEFASSFEGSNGIRFSETGNLQSTNDQKDSVLVKTGSFSYTSPEGIPVSVTYTADAYGFHPVSSNIPQAVAPVAPTFI